jgi:chaperonin GroES
VDAGYFVDADFAINQTFETDVGQQLADTSDDRQDSRHPDDHELHFYEMTVDWEFDWETHGKDLPYSLPYAITFEWETGRVVRIARVWNEADPKCKKDVWFVHYKFLPGLGFYGWGYLHLIGGLGRAAGGAMRLLLDGAAMSSLQGGFKSRDARVAGDMTFSPATWQDVDMTAEELAKSFYSPPFKEPTPALFSVFELLVQNIQRFTSTTENMVGDASNTGPVGTTIALIEQGSKVLSGIHKRLHAAARREFKLIAGSNYRYLDTEE